jgi:hypothetical protein
MLTRQMKGKRAKRVTQKLRGRRAQHCPTTPSMRA